MLVDEVVFPTQYIARVRVYIYCTDCQFGFNTEHTPKEDETTLEVVCPDCLNGKQVRIA